MQYTTGWHICQIATTPKIQTNMILGIAFAEAIMIFALVVALIIRFV